MDKLTETLLHRVLDSLQSAAESLRACKSIADLESYEKTLDARCKLAEARGVLGALLKREVV